MKIGTLPTGWWIEKRESAPGYIAGIVVNGPDGMAAYFDCDGDGARALVLQELFKDAETELAQQRSSKSRLLDALQEFVKRNQQCSNCGDWWPDHKYGCPRVYE